MKNPKQIIWTDNNTTPPVNYLWKKDGIVLENVGGGMERSWGI